MAEWLLRVGLSRSAEVGGVLSTGENQTFDLRAKIPNTNTPQLRATDPRDYFGVAVFRNAAANATVAPQQEWVPASAGRGIARVDRIGPGDRALDVWLCDRQHRRDGGTAEQQGSGFRAGSHLIKAHLGSYDPNCQNF
jgi:hypothetical protein